MVMHQHKQPIVNWGVVVSAILALMFPFATNVAAEKVDPAADKFDVAFKSLRPESGPIRLVGMQNNAQLSFPVSARQRISDIELVLYVTNSIVLTQRSHMAVAVNGVVIGQIPFRAQHPETRARITVPAELIQSGYNQIGFSVAQHASDGCEEPSSPELWSEIDTARSMISYKVAPQAIKPSLAELPLLMDKRLIGHYELTVVTAEELDDKLIEAGGLVAQAAALSRDYASVGIKHATLPSVVDAIEARTIAALPAELFDGRDGVLLGRRDDLKPWLDEETYTLAGEPLLALFPFGEKGDRFVLVVTGDNDDQVRQAAQTLVKAYAALPPTAKANIREMTAATLNVRPTLHPGVRQTFSDLNFRTETRQGILPHGMVVRFWVPADHFAYPNSHLNLSLHLAYGAGFGTQSVLNVFLNNHFEHAVRLAEPRGAVYYDYRIPIPSTSLAPGWNELHFRPSLIPQRAEGRCQPIYTENLLLTLFDDSTMESAKMLQLTELPDLMLFGRTGFPFAGGRAGMPPRLSLTDRASGTLEAAWTLVGKLAQVNHAPILGMSVVAPEHANGNTLLVGKLDKVPASLLEYSSLHRSGWWQLGPVEPGSGGVPGRVRGMDVSAAANSFVQPLDAFLERSLLGSWWRFGSAPSIADEGGGPEVSSVTDTALKVSLGNLLDHSMLITQFEPPYRGGHSIVMVVANNADVLSHQVSALIDDVHWGQLTGGTIVLVQDSNTVRNYAAMKTYLVGDAGLKARISHVFGGNPLMAIGVVAAAILLLALCSWLVLIAYRRRQHEGQAG